MEAAAPDTDRTRLRTLLGAFLFSGDDVDKRVGGAVGRREGAARARPDAGPAGALLCLDEPTNHLDLASREVLEDGARRVPGDDGLHLARPLLHQPPRDEGRRGPGRPAAHAPRRVRRLSRGRSTRPEASPAAPVPDGAPDHARSGGARTGPGRRRGGARPDGRGRAAAVRGSIRPCASSGGAWTALEGEIHALEARLAELGAALADPGLYADGERARAVTLERTAGGGAGRLAAPRVGDALRGAGRA